MNIVTVEAVRKGPI